MCSIIGKINSVGNLEGKGRDDLTHQTLIAAEHIIRSVSVDQSKAVRTIAENIRSSFQQIRDLLRKYEQNIEVVDPQLKNNADLVEMLVKYEQTWEKGLHYFLNQIKCKQLIHFSQICENAYAKYPTLQEQIDCREAAIFMTVPCLLTLNHLDHDDKNIFYSFLP